MGINFSENRYIIYGKMFPIPCPGCGHNKKINDPAPCVCIYRRKPCLEVSLDRILSNLLLPPLYNSNSSCNESAGYL